MTNLTNLNKNYVVTGLHKTLRTELSTDFVNNFVKTLVVS